jgi:3-oxoacyl-[acyl-carrier protein] reductase
MSRFDLSLNGKLALVTGATRGIGRETATLLAAHGAHVLVNGRNPDKVREVVNDIVGAGGAASPLVFDVGDAVATKAAFQVIAREHKRLDILVNNAGVLRDALIAMVSDETFNEIMRVNFEGTFRCAQLASRFMTRQKSGSIINLASIIGRYGNDGQSVYGASKAAVIGLTMSMSKELARSGLRVNAIAPGFIATDMISAVPEEKRRKITDNIGMGRLGRPLDVAKIALFLASDLSSYVTGQVIGVDGGMII